MTLRCSQGVLSTIPVLLLVLNVLLAFATVSCMHASESTHISSDEYVFIEHHIHTQVEAIVGNYSGKMIDSPTYSFDEKTGTLRGMISFDINETLKVVYGHGLSVGGVGGGRDTILHGIYKVPYQHYEFIISSLEVDGTVHLNYQDVPITLKSGDDWESTSSRIEVQLLENETCTANVTVTDRIANHGLLQKSAIETWW